MTMFIHFFCLCPLSLTIKLNFDMSKVVYLLQPNVPPRDEEEHVHIPASPGVGEFKRQGLPPF